MEQTLTNPVRTCRYCLKELPPEAFYTNSRTHTPDNYCMECRKAACRKRYHRSQIINDTRSYPVITDTQDRKIRMALILHAKQAVNESIARKRRKLREMVDE